MAIHSSTVAWRTPMDRVAWRSAVHGVAESRTRLSKWAPRCSCTLTAWSSLCLRDLHSGFLRSVLRRARRPAQCKARWPPSPHG